jgi:hypothetical protein
MVLMMKVVPDDSALIAIRRNLSLCSMEQRDNPEFSLRPVRAATLAVPLQKAIQSRTPS